MIRKAAALFALFAVMLSLAAPVALAQEAKCTGDPQMCAQILELKHQIEAQKQVAEQAKVEKGQAVQAEKGDEQSKAAHAMATAAMIAVVLKLLISSAKSWTDFFKTDKGKAAIRAGTLVAGFAAFVATNIGMGLVWWQALIIAGGPPGAILVHELTDLIPVFEGKKKLSDVPPTSPIDPADPQNPA